MRRVLTLIVAAAAAFTSCSKPRQYELRGQILAVDRTRQEITIKHGDIRGFMPGMTMPFKVRDPRLLEGRVAGDLVTATLVVGDRDAYLASVERTGHEAISDPPPPPASRMDVLSAGDMVEDVRMTDEAGATRSISEFRGKVLAVTFMYTRCPLPDFCPRMDQRFAAVQREVLADAGLRDGVRLLSISFDPLFDTPQVLAAHAQRAGADPRVWHFVTGDRRAIDAFASRFGVSIIRDEADAASLTHNLRTAVVRSDGRLATILGGNEWSAADLLDALRRARE